MQEPTWVSYGRTLLGIRETPGPNDNPTIMGWAKSLGIKVLGIVYNNDSATPWCGLFVAQCFRAAGVDLSGMKIAVRASSWATWGYALPEKSLAVGAILVFSRPGGGHVGFYMGHDATRYYVLGGNQGDHVSIAPILKSRCIARRWPTGSPKLGAPVLMASSDDSSRNEA